MNLRRLTGRAVAAGAISALAAGALVAVVSPAAQAADPVAVGYNCATALSPDPIPVVVGVAGFLSELTAGETVAPGDVPATFTLSRQTLDGMAAKGINQAGVSTSNFALSVGATPVKLTGVTTPKTAAPATGDLVLTAPSKNAAFTAPAAGTYDLTMPTAFDATVATNLIDLPVACTIADPSTAKIGSVTTAGDTVPDPVKQESSTMATAPAKIKQGKTLKISVTVTAEETPSGKVTAKEGSKKLGSASLTNGKATISVKGLKPGTHKIKVSYAGDDATTSSTSKTITVKVKKK